MTLAPVRLMASPVTDLLPGAEQSARPSCYQAIGDDISLLLTVHVVHSTSVPYN